MERGRYNRLIEEIEGCIDEEKLREALVVERKDRRMDMELMLLRDAVDRSSLGVYNGCIYHFGGKIYEIVEPDDFGNMIYDVMRKIGIPVGDFVKIESFIRVCRRRVNTNVLRVDNSVMVFRNCVLDLRKGEAMNFSRRYVQFSSVDYDYRGDAKCYQWKDFLFQVLPNVAYQMVLQEYIGSVFIDRREAKMETMLVLKGNGANGKSVVFETVVGLVGRSNVTNFGIDELIGYGTEKKRNLATMNGKRLNYASETGSFTIDGGSGLLKALISGEPVEARAMYGDNFTANDLPLIMINCNKMPKLKDFSHGMARRITIIPFDVEIPRGLQNKGLANELRDEYPGIFNWAMEGRRRFIENGYRLTEVDMLTDLVEDYQLNNCNLLEFMKCREYLKEDPDVLDAQPMWKPFERLYSEYHKWAISRGEIVIGKREATSTLADNGYRRRRTGKGIQYAIFGKAAYDEQKKQIEKQRLKLSIEEDAEVLERLDSKDVKDIKRRFAKIYGWDRVAVGKEELFKYLGYEVNIQYEMQTGRIDGTFKYDHRMYVYNLDLIDTIWKPQYDEWVKNRENGIEKRRQRLAQMKEYERLGIEEYLKNNK